NQNPGSLSVQLSLKESPTSTKIMMAKADDIRTVKAELRMGKGELSKETSASFSGNGTQLSFEEVYPGDWNLVVCAMDQNSDVIFQGACDVTIESGEHASTIVELKPADASLEIRFEASAIPGIGDTIKSGKIGICFDHTDTQAKYYDLTLSGTTLSALIHGLPEGSFSGKICIPNASSAIYTSPYFRINLNAGKTTSIILKPDGTISVNGVIDSTPPTPEIVNISLNGNTAILNWSAVKASDLAGYRIYRTDKSGCFEFVNEVAANSTQYSDIISSGFTYKGKITYVVSSYDQGGNESQWSNSFSITP
ncbi:MAG TPA: hypothetical protein VHR47_02465, partial [Bacillota bacterium]|nr:hypothetical protein [Bacillota bacterium]